MAITRFGLVTSENHHRLLPVLISQAGLHTESFRTKIDIFLKNLPSFIKTCCHAGWAAIGIFMWVWASGPVLRNRELRREVVGKYIYPQLEISQCKTEQERRDFVQAFIDAHYKDDDEEEDE